MHSAFGLGLSSALVCSLGLHLLQWLCLMRKLQIPISSSLVHFIALSKPELTIALDDMGSWAPKVCLDNKQRFAF